MQKPTAPTPLPSTSSRPARYCAAPWMSLRRAVHRQAHQQPLGLVRLVGARAVEEVRREGDEALGGEPVGDVADVVDQAPPLLHHDDARAVRRSPASRGSPRRSRRCWQSSPSRPRAGPPRRSRPCAPGGRALRDPATRARRYTRGVTASAPDGLGEGGAHRGRAAGTRLPSCRREPHRDPRLRTDRHRGGGAPAGRPARRPPPGGTVAGGQVRGPGRRSGRGRGRAGGRGDRRGRGRPTARSPATCSARPRPTRSGEPTPGSSPPGRP